MSSSNADHEELSSRVTRSRSRQQKLTEACSGQRGISNSAQVHPKRSDGESSPAASTGSRRVGSHEGALNTEPQRKKRRTSLTSRPVPTRSYNLRTTARRTSSSALNARTVTPASVARLLDFNRAADDPSQRDANNIRPNLPEGVIDIFALADENRRKCKSRRCIAPYGLEHSTETGAAHMGHYGEQYMEALRSQEEREMSDFTKPLEDLSDDESDDEATDSDSGKSKSGTESTSDCDSRPGTPQPGTLLKSRLREMASCDESPTTISNRPLRNQPHVSPRMRYVLVDWLVEVTLVYKISFEAFQLAITILDVLLDKGPVVHQTSLQAFGCACIWVASKVADKSAPSQEELAYISDHSFHTSELRLFEESICKVLKFRLQRVCPTDYVSVFLRASHACPFPDCPHENIVLRQLVHYFLELGRCSYELSFYAPSLLAASAVYLARATLGIREMSLDHSVCPKGYWTKTLNYYTGYSVPELRSTVEILHKLQRTAEDVKSSAFMKFKRSAFRSVSLKTALPWADLGFDAGATA